MEEVCGSLGFRVFLGLGVLDLGFRSLGFRGLGLGLRGV